MTEWTKVVVEQAAKELPEMRTVKLRMTNLHLHASGVFSNVYKGTLLSPGAVPREIAIKKTWPETRDRANFEMIFLTGISREKHKNIVQMLFAFSNRVGKEEKVCESFVFDFMPDTLASIIKKDLIDQIDLRLYTWQIFSGLKYLQGQEIVHRDIKPVNILIDHTIGLLKLGDFGSAKIVRPGSISTAYQVTRFYRPPELLLGSVYYNWTVDIWSAGCVVGEMMRGSVLFPGRDGKHQLKLIFSALGLPSESDLKMMRAPTRLEGSERVTGVGLATLVPECSAEMVFFLGKILVYKPKERYCGRELLRDSFFDPIFKDGSKRTNGQLCNRVVTPNDVQEIIENRKPKKNLIELMGKKKLDFTCLDGKEVKEHKEEPSNGGSKETLKFHSRERVRQPQPAGVPSDNTSDSEDLRKKIPKGKNIPQPPPVTMKSMLNPNKEMGSKMQPSTMKGSVMQPSKMKMQKSQQLSD